MDDYLSWDTVTAILHCKWSNDSLRSQKFIITSKNYEYSIIYNEEINLHDSD